VNALWTSAEVAAATLGCATRGFAAQGVSIDTRTLKPDELFVALKGESRDGHRFVSTALESGAAAALVSEKPGDVAANAPLLLVANTQRGLEDLGLAARKRASGKVVAVTGSAGKTTTKEILRLALGALGPTHASAASFNNHWGVPLSLARLPRDARFGVFEIGMNHFGEIRSLVGFVQRRRILSISAVSKPSPMPKRKSSRGCRRMESRSFRQKTPARSVSSHARVRWASGKFLPSANLSMPMRGFSRPVIPVRARVSKQKFRDGGTRS
jgi:hypothetical protein